MVAGKALVESEEVTERVKDSIVFMADIREVEFCATLKMKKEALQCQSFSFFRSSDENGLTRGVRFSDARFHANAKWNFHKRACTRV